MMDSEKMVEAVPPTIKAKLKKYPFPSPNQAKRTKPPLDAVERCRSIQSKLRCEMSPSDTDFELIKNNPEAAKWLKDNIEPRFWLKFESLASPQEHPDDT